MINKDKSECVWAIFDSDDKIRCFHTNDMGECVSVCPRFVKRERETYGDEDGYFMIADKWISSWDGKPQWGYTLFKDGKEALHCGYGGRKKPTKKDFEHIVEGYESLKEAKR